jgi:hypothetical protein
LTRAFLEFPAFSSHTARASYLHVNYSSCHKELLLQLFCH